MEQSGDHARTIGSKPLASINILEWISAPRKFSKGQNIQHHIKNVKRFLTNVKAPDEYHKAILMNTFDEDSQLEIFSHPNYDDDEENFERICNFVVTVFRQRKHHVSRMVQLLNEKQGTTEDLGQFLSRLRINAYKMLGAERKKENDEYILSAFLNGIRERKIARAIEAMKPEDSETALKMARKAESSCSNTQVSDCFKIFNEGKNNEMLDQRNDLSSDTCKACGHRMGIEKDISQLVQQVRFLSEQVTHLSNAIKYKGYNNQQEVKLNRKPSYRDVVKNGVYTPRNNMDRNGRTWNSGSAMMKCWNCGGGHYLRNRPKKIFCKKCRMAGHVSRFCDSENAVRYFNSDVTDPQMDSDSDIISIAPLSSQASENELPVMVVEVGAKVDTKRGRRVFPPHKKSMTKPL